MIEVEKKFILDGADKEALLGGAELLGTTTFTDVYYDTRVFDLTSKDVWLRLRAGRWELKMPFDRATVSQLDRYREYTTEDEIAKALNLPRDRKISDALEESGYRPFAVITTTRTKYRKQGFVIDIDKIDYGYDLVEIEMMVSDPESVPAAVEDILAFAEKYDLKLGRVRGKVVEYLRRYSPEHFRALLKAGVVTPLADGE